MSNAWMISMGHKSCSTVFNAAQTKNYALPLGPIIPKLLFLVDEETGQPVDARLAPETRAHIQQLTLPESLAGIRVTETEEPRPDTTCWEDRWSRKLSHPYKLVEVPLTTDSEFFLLLQSQLSELVSLQNEERKKLQTNIATIGQALVKATDPSSGSKAKHDLARWRRLFELYIDSRVFFATSEQDHGPHDFAEAQKRLMSFLEKAQTQGLLTHFKNKESTNALQQFVRINTELLQSVRFHEINQTAMVKILKSMSI
jgi:E3 ubiquitin-protein ligase BAH